jgi:hypothetical protein
MGTKKARKVIMFVWWFMVASGNGFNVNAIGPFDSREQCEYARLYMFKGIKTSQCWGVH